MDSSQGKDSGDSRFAHILQPIKDLTKNWDIDIAACLEDYLEELEQTTISFDGGRTTMNFAQAAMLVQSSACVYSKKVEYLYSLVYQVQEMLANNKKKQAQKSADNNESNAADGDGDDAFDDDEFLTLDDIEPSEDNYLKEDFEPDEKFQFLPEIPLCLIPLEEGEKGQNPLMSKKGEVLASRNDFKMNTCCIHPMGTLLLDMSHLALLEESFKLDTLRQTVTERESTEETPEMETGDGAPQNISADDHHEDDNMGDEIDGECPLGNISVPQPMEEEQEVNGDGLRRSSRERRPVNVQQSKPANKPQIDPWQCLDPYEEVGTPKPFKKGNIFRPCPGIDDITKKRKRKKATSEPQLESLSEFLLRELYSNCKKYPKNPMKVPTNPGLDAIFWEEFKRRERLRKDMKKMQKERNAVVEVGDEEAEEEEEHDDGDEVHCPAGLDNDEDVFDIEPLNLIEAINAGMENHNSFVNMVNGSYQESQEDGETANSYEELVRKHVEEYMASAQKYVEISELTRRVAEWEEKVLPRLEEEETHDPFDINIYGSNIINKLDKGRSFKFKQLVQGKPSFEICRTFLATLMLANTNNLRIKEKGIMEEGMDRFEVELLSTKRHFEELQEYQAPSLQQS